MTRTSITAIAVILLLGACASAPAESTLVAQTPAAASEPTGPSASPAASGDASPGASSAPSELAQPPDLLGTWRTTLGGQRVTLTLREDGTYSIHRGVSQGTGEMTVDGDRIDFFNGSLCEGTGEYRWTIDGDSLRFSSLTEPCPGRAEALLNVRYEDYSPP
jgi:hypothetical protein